MDLHEALTEAARSLGIPLSGSVDLSLAFLDGSFQENVKHYDHWLAAGYAGRMEYLHRGRNRRADPREVFPEARSVFSVALPYSSKAAGAESFASGPRYGRYLYGEDYHEKLTELLEATLQKVATQWNALHPEAPLKWKVCVDSSAVLERSWAALAGLGWIGKNTLLIHPKFGSFLYLGEVLLNQETGHGPNPLPNFCGNCTRCLKSCPTKALPSPHTLDSNQCISYWTLEKRGKLELPEQKKTQIGSWIAGCDLCQEACPFNWKGMKASEKPQTSTDEEIPNNPQAIELNQWENLLRESPHEYRARVKNSSLNRVKDYQFSRNLAITLSNAVSQISEQNRTQIEVLVRERYLSETHEVAKEEWLRCLKLTTDQSSGHKLPQG
jgi:epoxyqueuosine reductase